MTCPCSTTGKHTCVRGHRQHVGSRPRARRHAGDSPTDRRRHRRAFGRRIARPPRQCQAQCARPAPATRPAPRVGACRPPRPHPSIARTTARTRQDALTALLRRLRGLVADRDPTAPRRVLTSHFSAGPTAGEPAYDSSADVVDHPGSGGSSRSCGESPLTGPLVRLAAHAGRAEGTGARSGTMRRVAGTEVCRMSAVEPTRAVAPAGRSSDTASEFVLPLVGSQ